MCLISVAEKMPEMLSAVSKRMPHLSSEAAKESVEGLIKIGWKKVS